MKAVRHIIGSSHTYQTALMCCEYLNKRLNLESVIRFEHNAADVYHPFSIFYDAWIIPKSFDLESKAVDLCRAFIAGRGEVWA